MQPESTNEIGMRFVIQEHDTGTDVHWDLMLEEGTALVTWSLLAPPDTEGTLKALKKPDHRKAYLSYEGPVSGSRGVVRIWDRGTFRPLAPFGRERLEFRLSGARLSGVFRLVDSSRGQAGGGRAEEWVFERCQPL